MCHMEEAWNIHMAEEFNPSWINELEKRKMECFKKYTPGFVCVGRKPPPFSNERHTFCCGLTSIFWRFQKLEGKYFPQQLEKKLCSELGKR